MSNFIPQHAIVEGPEGKPVMVTWGDKGFIEFTSGFEPNQEVVDKFNKTCGADTPEKLMAMKTGSMFGWDCGAVTQVFGDVA